MMIIDIIRSNFKIIFFGFVFTFFSCVGQSFFIGLFNSNIREELNISHGEFGTLYGVKELNFKINNILEQINLAHVAQLPVRNFSSGMTKRLMIGRLMLCQPEILILDEPYTGLDQHTFRWFQHYLREFHQQGGTVLMVTHQFELGLELATRVLVLHQQSIRHDVSVAGLSVDQCSDWLEE